MNKKPTKSKHLWAKVGLVGFWAVMGVLAIAIITIYGIELSGVSADPGGAGVGTDVYKPNAFADLVCVLYFSSGTIIGALMVLMFVSAGIVYATSQGQSGGETSGIGLAKSMMLAALTGGFLYVIGLMLLGEPCGANPSGGILQQLLGNIQF